MNAPRGSDRFRISKDRRPVKIWPWYVAYPTGFSDCVTGRFCYSFDEAVAHYAEAVQWRCPSCGAGAVFDTKGGWECAACGSSDVAALEPVVEAPRDAPKPSTHAPARERSKPVSWATVGANKARAKARKEREQ